MKIAFIADFFDSHLLGGAELNDAVLLKHLDSHFEVTRVLSKDVNVQDLHEYDCLVISNFCMISEKSKNYIQSNTDYIIYEHDHKYVSTRDPSQFVEFSIPEKHIINLDFYRNAKKVICLGQKQVDIISNNLKISNLHSISCSLWSKEKLQFLKKLSKKTQKTKKYAIVNSNNQIKNTQKAIEFCKTKGLDYELISSRNPYEFIEILSKFENLVFFPGVLESMCRLVVEAKMVNCRVITTPKMLGASYEPWFQLNGEPLVSKISENVDIALKDFLQIIRQQEKS